MGQRAGNPRRRGWRAGRGALKENRQPGQRRDEQHKADEGDPDLVAQIIATLPPEVGSVIGDLSAHAFAEYAQRLYGTATPERIGASR